MRLIDDLKNVSLLFKNTFCRSFILYGSNIIPAVKDVIDVARMIDLELYEKVSSRYLLDDTISPYLNNSWLYAFDTVYEVDGCKFYMASYWDFRCILAAADYFAPSLYFRYTTKYNDLCEFMVLNTVSRLRLMRTITLLFGDCLKILANVSPWVEKMNMMQQSDVLDMLRYRWLSLSDLPTSYLEELNVPLIDIECTMADVTFISTDLAVFGCMETNIKVSDIIKTKTRLVFDLFDEIDRLSGINDT